MRQFILTTPDGRALGVVLDDRPMREADEAAFRLGGFAARRLRDVAAIAEAVGAAYTCELVHRPRVVRHRRRYPTLTYARRIDA